MEHFIESVTQQVNDVLERAKEYIIAIKKAKGYTNRDLAHISNLSEDTIKNFLCLVLNAVNIFIHKNHVPFESGLLSPKSKSLLRQSEKNSLESRSQMIYNSISKTYRKSVDI